MQPGQPARGVGLRGEAARAVHGEACRADDGGAAAQQLERDAEADLHPPPRDQRHAAAQLARLIALAPVELRAAGAERLCWVQGAGSATSGRPEASS